MNFNELLLGQIKKFYESERWKDHDSPLRTHIPELWELIDNPEIYKKLRQNKNLGLLLEIVETLEEQFNDEDWLPYELFGLELKDVRLFLGEILKILPELDENKINQAITQCSENILHKS